MNLNGLVLNLSPSGLCVHLVVGAAASCRKKTPPQITPLPIPARKRACVCKKNCRPAPLKKTNNKKKNPQTRAEK